MPANTNTNVTTNTNVYLEQAKNLPLITPEDKALIRGMVSGPHSDILPSPSIDEQHKLATLHPTPLAPSIAPVGKQWTMQQVLVDTTVINILLGVQDCPFQAWLIQNQKASIAQLEDMIRTHPMWCTPLCILFVATAHFLNNEADAAELQRSYTHRLLTSPTTTWKGVKHQLQRLLRGPVYGGLDQQAYNQIVSYMTLNEHPMDLFLAQPEVHNLQINQHPTTYRPAS